MGWTSPAISWRLTCFSSVSRAAGRGSFRGTEPSDSVTCSIGNIWAGSDTTHTHTHTHTVNSFFDHQGPVVSTVQLTFCIKTTKLTGYCSWTNIAYFCFLVLHICPAYGFGKSFPGHIHLWASRTHFGKLKWWRVKLKLLVHFIWIKLWSWII